MTSFITEMSLKGIYDYLYNKKKKEKLDYILEPLQAMIQLSALSFCPKGSKLTIQNNILTIQLPSMTQGIIRYFNDDNKEDLYYLINVFKRFFIYYSFMNKDEKLCQLYNLLIKLSSEGIDKLIETYSNSDRISIIQNLKMYKLLLDKPELILKKSNNLNNITNERNIDNIFKDIINIYKNEEYIIIYNILILMSNNPDLYSDYLNGINFILFNKNLKIHEWIDKNIVF